MKTLITLTLTAAEGGDNGVKIPADGIAIFDPKNGQVNADGDLVSGDRVKATVANGVLLDAEGNDGVWLEPGQYWASVASVTSRVTKYVEVPESDEPILLTSLFELEAVPAWRLTEGVVDEVKQARDEAVAAVEGLDDDIEQTVTDLLLSGEIELPPGEQGPEGPEGPQGPPGPPGADGKDGADGERGPEGPRGPKGEDGAPGAPGADGNDGASAYQVAVAAGFAGTEAEWLDSLVGEEGPQGPAGADGADGEQGPEGPQGIQGEPGVDGSDGADGKSAYQIAVDEGFVGDESAFLDSLVGPEGPQGEQGPKGEKGDAGEIPDVSSFATKLGVADAVNAAKVFVNVKDYGAVGDGSTDDTVAIQSAVTTVDSVGGGTVFFPAGLYRVDGSVRLASNMEITGRGATLKKLPGTPYAFFVARSTSYGYGGSVSNVACRGLVFEGTIAETLGASRTACGFALHHASNVLVEDCRFRACAGAGHRLDLQGCEKITVRNCVFEGFDDRYGGSSFIAEDIQLDNSTRVGTSTTGDGYWDGLPCRDIIVEGNKWVPWYSEALGRELPSGNAVGSHSSVEGMYHENVRIVGNLFVSTVLDTSNAYFGTIHFASWKNVVIDGNTFEGRGGNMRPVNIQGVTHAVPLDEVESTEYSASPLAVHQMCSDVKIINNRVTGCVDPASPTNGLINIYRHGVSFNNKHASVLVSGNTFEGNKNQADPKPFDGATLIYAGYVDGLSVTGNRGEMCRRLARIVHGNNVSVEGNAVANFANESIAIESSSEVRVSGNTVSGYSGSPVMRVQSSTNPMVSGNQVVVSGGAIVAVRLRDCTRPQAVGNLLESTESTGFGSSGSPFSSGLEVSGTSTKAVVTGNVIVRASDPVRVIDSADAVVNDRNTYI